MAILHQPSTNKKLKRVSRLVILPDYQGIGLGTKFLDEMGEIYSKLGWDFSIITSVAYFKENGKELLDIDTLLNKKVKTSERVGNEKIVITYYMYR